MIVRLSFAALVYASVGGSLLALMLLYTRSEPPVQPAESVHPAVIKR